MVISNLHHRIEAFDAGLEDAHSGRTCVVSYPDPTVHRWYLAGLRVGALEKFTADLSYSPDAQRSYLAPLASESSELSLPNDSDLFHEIDTVVSLLLQPDDRVWSKRLADVVGVPHKPTQSPKVGTEDFTCQ